MYRYRESLVDRHPEQTLTPLKRRYTEGSVYGYDTEFMTTNGLATIMTWATKYHCRAFIVELDSKPLDKLVSWVAGCPHNSVVFAHNLAVDLWAVLNYEGTPQQLKDSWYAADSVHIGLAAHKLDIRINYKKPVFADFRFKTIQKGKPKTRRLVRFLDSTSFFGGSLDKLSKAFFNEGKDTIPEEMYSTDWRTETEGRERFVDYAKQDTILVRRIGEVIVDEHKKRDIPVSVSTPSLAGFTVRKSLSSKLPPLPAEVFNFALQTYYGGRVQTFQKGTISRPLRKFDLNSAYPAAIKLLPDLRMGEWEKTRQLYPFAFYYADVTVLDTSLPYMAPRQTTLYPIGRYTGYWAGVELLSAYTGGYIRINNLQGWRFNGKYPILSDFVDEQFKLKSAYPKSNPLYAFNKLIANALYGKFHNLNPDKTDEETGRPVLTPGALFNPCFSSFVTAHCRAKILDAQKALGSEMVNIQTDGLWTTGELETSDALGEFSIEAEADKMISIRGNAYIPFKNGVQDLQHTKLHAYQGESPDIMDVLSKGSYEYDMWLRPYTAFLNRLNPNTIVRVTRSFKWNRLDYKMKFPYINSSLELFLAHSETGNPWTLTTEGTII